MLERPSNEILKNLSSLLIEYQNAVYEENRIKDERIDVLEAEVAKLKAKNAAIARILTGES